MACCCIGTLLLILFYNSTNFYMETEQLETEMQAVTTSCGSHDGMIKKNITVVFLMHLGSSPPRLTSASLHRGISIGNVLSKQKTLNVSAILCSRAFVDVAVDVYVHVKKACGHILSSAHHAHIHDLIDSTQGLGALRDGFTGTIFASEFDMMNRCKTQLCAVIPHHFNLDVCNRTRPLRKNGVGLVGTSYTRDSVAHLEHNFGLKLVAEVIGQPCAFFRSIRIAIAWKGARSLKYEDAPGGNEQVKPAERYTNPVNLGIPTVGYRGYRSFREYGDTFLCGNYSCLQSLIERIDSGELDSAFKHQQQLVARDTGAEATTIRYQALFVAAMTAVKSGNVLLLNQENFECGGEFLSHVKIW